MATKKRKYMRMRSIICLLIFAGACFIVSIIMQEKFFFMRIALLFAGGIAGIFGCVELNKKLR